MMKRFTMCSYYPFEITCKSITLNFYYTKRIFSSSDDYELLFGLDWSLRARGLKVEGFYNKPSCAPHHFNFSNK